MNFGGGQNLDAVDVLLTVGMFASFVAFGICMWLIRRERDKRKKAENQNAKPPKIFQG